MKVLFASVSARSPLAVAALIVASACFAPALQGQEAWPSRPIRLIIPSAPGGATDFVGRLFSSVVGPQIKQPIVPENIAGAGAIVGSQVLKAAAPDGYTFMVGGSSVSAANPVLYAKLPYDPVKDFDEVGMVGYFPIIGMVKKDSPINSVADIVRIAKANPGKLSFGYYSPLARISPELIMSRTGVEFIGVSYKNIAQISTDVAGGVIDFTFLDALASAPALKGGLLRPIAVTSPQRVATMPSVPTVAETLPGFEVQGWIGFSAPKGIPTPILDRMNGLLRGFQMDPSARAQLEAQGMIVRPTPSPAEHAKLVAADRARWVEWVRIAKIPPQ